MLYVEATIIQTSDPDVYHVESTVWRHDPVTGSNVRALDQVFRHEGLAEADDGSALVVCGLVSEGSFELAPGITLRPEDGPSYCAIFAPPRPPILWSAVGIVGEHVRFHEGLVGRVDRRGARWALSHRRRHVHARRLRPEPLRALSRGLVAGLSGRVGSAMLRAWTTCCWTRCVCGSGG